MGSTTAYQTAMLTRTADTTIDGDRAAAIIEALVTMRPAYDATGMLSGGVDGACRLQVLDVGRFGVAEGCQIVSTRKV